MLTTSAVRAAPDDDSRYERLAETYFNATFVTNPVGATLAGVHTYDHKLGSYAAADWNAQLALDRGTLARIGTLDVSTLSPDVIARESSIPHVVAQAKANLSSVDHESAAIAVDDALGAVAFLRDTVPPVFANVGTASDRAALQRSTRIAIAATKGFADYIRRRFVAHPSGTYAIGAANYSARLKDEEGIDMPLAAYLRVGTRALAETRAQMVATAKLIDPNVPVGTVVKSVMRVHPSATGLLPAAKADLVRLRRFIVAHDIIALPSDGNIQVTETPAFLRQTTVASMDAPGPLENVATRAYYNVTPVDPHDSKATQEAYLETFNDFERPIFSAHEVYPGHYTQYIINKHQSRSLTKKLLGATSFIEGWAHYSEQMIVDEGWGNGDPRVRLMQLKEAILRNARYVVGVKLHTQGMTLGQAEKFFETQAFLDPADARIESRRGTQDATYGYYTLGKLEILKLRDDYRKKLGPAYSLAKFHAALLAHGSPPIPLLRPLLLGDSDDGVLLAGERPAP